MKDDINISGKVIEEMAGTIEHIVKILEETVRKNSNKQTNDTLIIKELDSVKESLGMIIKVLHIGNGERPLVTRVAGLETRIAHMEKTKEIERKEHNTQVQLKWGIAASIIIAILSAALNFLQ